MSLALSPSSQWYTRPPRPGDGRSGATDADSGDSLTVRQADELPALRAALVEPPEGDAGLTDLADHELAIALLQIRHPLGSPAARVERDDAALPHVDLHPGHGAVGVYREEAHLQQHHAPVGRRRRDEVAEHRP